VQADINVVGFLAVTAVERAIVNAIKNAEALHGYKAYKDLRGILNTYLLI